MLGLTNYSVLLQEFLKGKLRKKKKVYSSLCIENNQY